MEYTKENSSEMDKEKFVADIVIEILNKCPVDDYEIKEVIVDDYGHCIHVTFTGAVETSTIIEIGEAFGDDNPNVYAESENAINLIIINEKYECLIDEID